MCQILFRTYITLFNPSTTRWGCSYPGLLLNTWKNWIKEILLPKVICRHMGTQIWAQVCLTLKPRLFPDFMPYCLVTVSQSPPSLHLCPPQILLSFMLSGSSPVPSCWTDYPGGGERPLGAGDWGLPAPKSAATVRRTRALWEKVQCQQAGAREGLKAPCSAVGSRGGVQEASWTEARSGVS